MSQIDTEIATLLRRNGLSVTKQRLTVFALLEGREPISMYELYELAREQLDRASLYRTIATFEKLGIVRRVNIGWKYKVELNDMFSEHHHHLTCLNCHTVIPMSEDELETFIDTVATRHHFTPIEHEVEIQGYCENCCTQFR